MGVGVGVAEPEPAVGVPAGEDAPGVGVVVAAPVGLPVTEALDAFAVTVGRAVP